MRKNISGKIALFGILALLVVLTVLSASAVSDAIRGDAIRSDAIRGDAIRGDAIRGDAIRSDAIRSDAIYIRLRPDPASIPEGECHSVTVDVLMYSKPGYTVNSWGTWIQFDPTCVNITDYEYKSDMNSNTQWQHLGDRIKLWNYKAACSEYLDETVLVSLTVHCENPSYCESPLNFIDNDVPPDKFVACVLEERTTTWHDGTIIQGTTELPDLNVTEITPNCGYLFAKEGNEICAKIENIGGGDAGAFNVRFEIDGFSTEVGIAGLAAGENTTVCITDTTIRNAADFVTITVTADCDGEVPESDEQNNVLSLETTVVNNGYKGKRYTGGEDINTWDTFALNGNLIYSPGDSYYLSAYYNPDWTEYNVGWTTGDLPIPGTATIETARLFVPYTWDKAEVIPGSVDMSFNGNLQTLDAHYSDEKSWGASYPYGMLVYDVTTDFDTLGNVANLTNSHPGGDNVSMRGMLLVVVYADDSEPERTILMNEGFDLLYGGAGKCTTPEEATAYAPFGSIDTTEVQQATLITVAPGAGPNEGELGFNTQMWYDVWNFVGSTQIGIAETDVTSYLQAGDNEAYFRSSADYMEASNAFLILEMKPKPDLNVTEITPNCGYLFAKEGNEICAKIENIGGGDAGAFNVRFEIDGFSTEVGIAGLAAGENTTVCITDTTIRNAADFVTITVTADCDGEVPESDEQNNVLSLETTVVNNGYKGKRYTGGEDINTWDTFALNGNLIYSPGDSYYLSAYYNPDWTEYNVGWTTGDLPIPGTATIETARLFVPYTWDKAEVIPGSVDMSFNGNLQTLDAHYSDEKSWGASYPYGMLVYDVTTDFDTLGNVANLTNSHPGGDNVSMRGMLLVVVYADDSEPERTILMNEGFDLLYGGAGKCTTPEEATAYAPFGSIDTTEVQQATLITVAPGAGPNEGELGFNTQMWYDVWNFVGSTQIGIAETDVTSYLQAGDNEAYFRSSADYMEASNAFLILEMKPKPDLNVTEITPNCGYLFAKEGNEICAKIENIGGGDAGAFNVRFEIDGFSTEVGIAGLAAGENTTVCITDTTIRNAADFVTITVTADCDGEVPESDEQNNVLSLETTVVNNGYKGKRYTGGEDINTWDTFALNGNLIYSPGDSYYLSAYYNPDWTEYNVGWTTGDLPIPGTATIETARLFVPYTWDKAEVIPGSVDMSFNGNLQTLDAHYSDEKSWGASYPYGMLVYDVTTDFDTLGNVANLTNSHPGGDNVSMRGMLLVVVYADDSEPERTILMNEGFDLLYGGAGKCTTPEEATAYAPFGSIDTTEVQQATLITVAPGAGPNEGELGFNTQMWYDVWNFVGSTQIGIAETDVTSYLQAGDNEAYFRSSADYMEASNAFLILEMKGEIPCPADYALYQANVRDPEGRLNELRALRDQKLDDGYVDKYYDNSPALTLVLSKADSDLVKEGAQLVSKYSIPVGLHVQGMDVNERITKQDVEEALSFTGRLKIEVLENRDAIGAKSTEAIIDFIDEFEGQVKASEGKTFSAALKSSIYYESGQLRANPAVVKE